MLKIEIYDDRQVGFKVYYEGYYFRKSVILIANTSGHHYCVTLKKTEVKC